MKNVFTVIALATFCFAACDSSDRNGDANSTANKEKAAKESSQRSRYSAEECLASINFTESSRERVDTLREKLEIQKSPGEAQLIALDLQKATAAQEGREESLRKSLDSLSDVENGDEWLAIFDDYANALRKARVSNSEKEWRWLSGLTLDQVIDRFGP